MGVQWNTKMSVRFDPALVAILGGLHRLPEGEQLSDFQADRRTPISSASHPSKFIPPVLWRGGTCFWSTQQGDAADEVEL